ncbi:MAG: RIO1 family regulatory kinase/ATPase [Candidatus Melainabacteria bacterium]|nr:RIO1 family regulatory kinase/ATPase [Candidatus Melainabacteria bacterium]
MWESTAYGSNTSKTEFNQTASSSKLLSDSGQLSVILKTCQWGDPKSPFNNLRRLALGRESEALIWMEKNTSEIAPKPIYFDDQQLVMERLSGPDFFSDQKNLADNRKVWERLNNAVNRMHEGGLAHGELRLGNLIFHNDEVRLVDFATACTKNSSFYKPVRWLDRMAILWMKAHIFQLPLDSDELSLQDNHKVLHQWFLKYIACDIPYA